MLSNPYASVDPAPAAPQATVAELKKQYLDTAQSLFHRYRCVQPRSCLALRTVIVVGRALFALRNVGDVASVEAIVEGLTDSSALFRHEVGTSPLVPPPSTAHH